MPGTALPFQLRPVGALSTARYLLRGRPLLMRLAARLARVPSTLTPAARQRLQNDVARHLLAHLRAQLTVSGLEHARGGPFVVAALHESLIDPLLLLTLPLPLRFAARDELFGWPLIGPALTRLGHLCVTPERGSEAYRTLRREGAAILAGGESLALFPQGSVLGLETDFLPGAFALARALGVPVLPVALSGGHRVWEHPYTPALRYGQALGMRVLPPLSAAAVRAAPTEELRLEVQAQLKAAALSGELPAPRRYVPERDGWWDGYRFEIDPAFPDLARRVAERRAAHPTGGPP